MQTDKPKVLWDKLLVLKTPILNISWVFNSCLTCLILLYTWGPGILFSYFLYYSVTHINLLCWRVSCVCGKHIGENKHFGNLGFIVTL